MCEGLNAVEGSLPAGIPCGSPFHVRTVGRAVRFAPSTSRFPVCSLHVRAEHCRATLKRRERRRSPSSTRRQPTQGGDHHWHEIFDTVFTEVLDDTFQFIVHVTGQGGHGFREERVTLFARG